MHLNSKLTKEEKQQIIQLASEGIGYTEISKRLNNKVSKQRVKQICLKEGIDAFNIKRAKSQLEREERMFKKWGAKWKDKDHRRSYLYISMRQKFQAKKANATRVGKPWDIEFGDLVFPTHCPILGIELDYFSEMRKDNSPSFDCINPSLGYIKGNVVIISWRANRIKNDGTAEEHRLIASFIEEYDSPSVA